jgi:hypothetical protein
MIGKTHKIKQREEFKRLRPMLPVVSGHSAQEEET